MHTSIYLKVLNNYPYIDIISSRLFIHFGGSLEETFLLYNMLSDVCSRRFISITFLFLGILIFSSARSMHSLFGGSVSNSIYDQRYMSDHDATMDFSSQDADDTDAIPDHLPDDDVFVESQYAEVKKRGPSEVFSPTRPKEAQNNFDFKVWDFIICRSSLV